GCHGGDGVNQPRNAVGTPAGGQDRTAPRRRVIDLASLPATGAWREGDDPGHRQFVDIGPLALVAGGRLPNVRLAYETWGELNEAGDNAVLVLHALTGGSHVAGHGPGDEPGWWEQIVGPGRAIDTTKYFVVAPNVLGGCQGSTGPSSAAPDGSPWGSRFPLGSARDTRRGTGHVARDRGRRPAGGGARQSVGLRGGGARGWAPGGALDPPPPGALPGCPRKLRSTRGGKTLSGEQGQENKSGKKG